MGARHAVPLHKMTDVNVGAGLASALVTGKRPTSSYEYEMFRLSL